MQFGDYESFGKFISSYKAAHQRHRQAQIDALPTVDQKAAVLRQGPRDIAEVMVKVVNYEGVEQSHDGSHQVMYVVLTQILHVDQDEGIQAALQAGSQVFVAVRVGDSEGLSQPVPGVADGVALHMKGQWIPASQAYGHGGEKTDVLHFTHHPIGFVCNGDNCFQ
jgi:endonuclease G